MLVQILAGFRRIITLPVISPKPTSFGSASGMVADFGDKGTGIGVRRGRRRLRVEGSAPGGFIGGFT
jgi:hypothetical protein